MKLILGLLLLLPLASIAAEPAGKPAPEAEAAQKASEHGGKAMEHGGKAMEMKGEAGAAAEDASAAAAEEGAQQMQKKTSEHAGSPVK